MDNKELNLCHILKDCPKGIKLYTPLYGICELYSVDDKFVTVEYVGTVSIICNETFFANGAISELGDECLLFPSRDNRDWSAWKNPKPNVERFDPKMLKPFDKVLVRDYRDDTWRIELYSSMYQNGKMHRCLSTSWVYAIPYNDDTKHLVGTTDEVSEYYRYWED